MKRRIKVFIQTYFYFNKIERKGIFSLLVLVFLLQGISMLYAALSAKTMPIVEEQFFVQLNQVDSTYSGNKYLKTYSKNSFNKSTNFKNKTFFEFKKDSLYKSYKQAVPKVLELNSADSVELVSLPKIGPVLASRIIQYRGRLGGFYSLTQLTEIWGFKEDLLFDLEGKISLNSSLVQQINVNTVALELLKKHPYFKYTLSQALVNYRTQHGVFTRLEELKNIKLVNDSIYTLILPYCKLN